MRRIPRRGFRLCYVGLVAALSAAVALGCGGDSLVLPGEGEPAEIELLAGNGQNGRAGEALAHPLVVRVTDTQDRPVPDIEVNFRLVSGAGAEIAPQTDRTDETGEASTTLVLGSAVGEYVVEAEAASPSDLELVVQFTATALAANADEIVAVDGLDQSAPVGSALGEPLVVEVKDAFGNPIADVPVEWSAVGGGSVSASSTRTGADGRTSVRRTLGPAAGRQMTLAAADGLAGSPVTFVHTALAGSASRVVVVSGDEQSAEAGSTLPAPIVVQVLDAEDNPVAGRAVSWVITGGGGSVDPTSSTTGEDGRASTTWTLGGAPGANSVKAVVSGVGEAGFTATATPTAGSTPTTIAEESGDGQSALVGTTLAAPLKVKVTSESGAGVSGVVVTWTAVGGGSVSSSTSTTDAQGIAQVFRTLGTTAGTYTTTAAVDGLSGSPVTFTSTATPGAPPVLVLVTSPPATARSGEAFDPQPVVQIRDADGDDLATADVVVTAALTSGSGDLIGATTATTNASGRAQFSGLGIQGTVGSYRIIFAADGYTAATSPAITLEAGAPDAGTSALEATPSTVAAGASSTVRATVRDVSGNPVPGVAVVLEATGSGNTITPSSATTGDGGVAEFTFSSTAAGEKTLTARVGDVTITQTATVTVTAGGPDPGRSTLQATSSSIPIGGTTTVRATVRDADGNPLSGASVTLQASGSGNTIEGSPATTDAQGVAEFTFGSSVAEAKTLSASVSGTVVAQTTVTVAKLASTTSITGDTPDPSDPDEQVTVTVQVTDESESLVPSGNVTVTGPAGATCTATLDGAGAGSCQLVLTESGQLTATYAGDAQFEASSSAAVDHTVNAPPPPNEAPTASDDAYTTAAGEELVVSAPGVLGNDSDPEAAPLTAELQAPPASGTVTLSADGSFTYTPAADFAGDVTFTYVASDGTNQSNVATVTITVTAPEMSPPEGDGAGSGGGEEEDDGGGG